MSHSEHESHGSDQKAAFTGMIVTALALFALAYGIVIWTNGRYAGEAHGEQPAASATQAH